ncbi:hypothetical protein [Filimonas effusa]|uniref:HNH endonuclease 5 domain-containing protein n=1 Tax=Filimonas effusa TaxID=2508721 RepID=A0A4Q1D0J8_9BACT|nr:hypothetical protein [Filimonas effusa]RXK81276.1 hypothetical protein ESB13_20280 [Filimonas effusa]
MRLGVSKEMIGTYIKMFSGSLKHFSYKYESRFFRTPGVIPDYFCYICPICVENHMIFFKEGWSCTAEFSLDHFPPKNVGGDLKGLVCKTCNNNAGGLFDFITEDFLHFAGFHRKIPNSTLKTKSEIKGVKGKYKSHIIIDESGELRINFKPNDKSKIPFLDEWLDTLDKREDWEVQLTIPKIDQKNVTKAFLKAAYLACFNQWGYEFIYSNTGEMIRKVWRDEVEYPFSKIPFLIFDSEEDLKRVPKGVSFFRKPVEFQSFLVNIPMNLKENKYECIASVIIPHANGWQDLSKLNLIHSDTKQLEISLTTLVPALSRRKYDGYSSDWDMFYNK